MGVVLDKQCSNVELERGELLSALKTYKPSQVLEYYDNISIFLKFHFQTIFEVNSTAKGVAKKVMLSKRYEY